MAEQELEQFRREWQAEVRARDRALGARGRQHGRGGGSISEAQIGEAPPPTRRIIDPERAVDGNWNFDDLEERERARRLGESGTGEHPEAVGAAAGEPKTALEHYEYAVECETQGRLGDSVAHYRRAFKLNDRVDQQFRNKHFPPSSFVGKGKGANESSSVQDKATPQSSGEISELIASFADVRIEGPPPEIEGATAPKCPIASVPTEVLTEILLHCALVDISSFARIPVVCKRFAFLVAAEDAIWKRVCVKSRSGLNSMHYRFACTIKGKPLKRETTELPKLEDLSLSAEANPLAKVSSASRPEPLTIPLTPTYPSYRHMFRHRPRVRFGGVYISTVNYVRPGASAPTQHMTWSTPLHVVTYYRYLRFYRDGSCISLLTTVDPPEVVPFFRRDHHAHEEPPGAIASPGLLAVSRHTLRGRWRTSALHTPGETDPENPAPADKEEQELEPEGNVLVETAGPTPAYTYSLQLQLRSAGPKTSARNTKLVWRGFWSYNSITDDWAEFGLRNDRAFVWSRVKSWGDA